MEENSTIVHDYEYGFEQESPPPSKIRISKSSSSKRHGHQSSPAQVALFDMNGDSPPPASDDEEDDDNDYDSEQQRDDSEDIVTERTLFPPIVRSPHRVGTVRKQNTPFSQIRTTPFAVNMTGLACSDFALLCFAPSIDDLSDTTPTRRNTTPKPKVEKAMADQADDPEVSFAEEVAMDYEPKAVCLRTKHLIIASAICIVFMMAGMIAAIWFLVQRQVTVAIR
ncbi:MAG: hypothetical protein SGBAC_010008 [Bacillariaceae sp.]